MPLLKVSLFLTERGTWSWMVGDFACTKPEKEGCACDTPQQALKEALWSIGFVSCLLPPKGHA